MNPISKSLIGVAAAALVAGCASFESLKPGSSMAEVEQQFKAPTTKRTEAGGNQVWAYDRGPEGGAFWLLTFGADGKLAGTKQALSEDNFQNLRAGQMTRDDVAGMLGMPLRKFNFTGTNDEVWDYRYRSGPRPMLLSVHFDMGKGTVRHYVAQPDWERESPNDAGN